VETQQGAAEALKAGCLVAGLHAAPPSIEELLRERGCPMKPVPTTRGMAASLKRLGRKSHPVSKTYMNEPLGLA
jgi:hypothetical protein